jgi:phenylalanyl-tRNA synthetase beta chain
MRVSLKWLEELLHTSLDIEYLKTISLSLGFEVEDDVHNVPEGIVIGKIEDLTPHPTLNESTVLHIKTSQILQIVTAAKNVKKGDLVLVCPAGTTFKEQMVGQKKFGNIVSHGMLVSEQELGLAEHSEGVIVLEKGRPGQRFQDIFDDVVLDMSTTPNRPDWLSVEGIARDIATRLDIDYNRISPTNSLYARKQQNRTASFKIKIQDIHGCPRYTGRIFDSIKVEESPFWMKWRLYSMGMNPINNVVDITNLMMLLTGQPLHPFDLDLLKGGITIRKARNNEEFTTLEGTSFTLDKDDLLITDAQGPIALAGIIGAQRAQISTKTKKVLLESAYFNPQRIAHSSRRLDLITEASMRFEEGADISITDAVSALTSTWFSRYAQAQEIQFIGVGKKGTTHSLQFSPKRLNKVLSLQLTVPQIKKILKKVGVSTTGKGILKARIPHYRRDLNIEEDIYEEVARLYGYMNIPEKPPASWGGHTKVNKGHMYEEILTNYLIGQGFDEVYTLSLLASADLREYGFNSFVTIKNPLNERFDALRPTLFVGLLNCVHHNLAKGNRSLRLFEKGNILLDKEPYQEKRLAAIIGGEHYPEFWGKKDERIIYYDAKGIVENLFTLLHIKPIEFKKTRRPLLYQAVDILHSGKILGHLGAVDEYACKEPYFYFELSLGKIFSLISAPFYIPPPRFPANTRDLSFLVHDNVEVPYMIKTIKKVGGPVLEKVILFDFYKGAQIPAETKNLGFRLYFRAPDRTLTDKEVDKFINKIEGEITRQFDAKLRKKE